MRVVYIAQAKLLMHPLCFGRAIPLELVLGKVLHAILGLQVLHLIVRPIPVFMVDMMSVRDRSVVVHPHRAMKVGLASFPVTPSYEILNAIELLGGLR